MKRKTTNGYVRQLRKDDAEEEGNALEAAGEERKGDGVGEGDEEEGGGVGQPPPLSK